MAIPLEEMWKDLEEADRLGDEELARLIYARIEEAEREKPNDVSPLRGIAGGVNAALARGVAALGDYGNRLAQTALAQDKLGVPEDQRWAPFKEPVAMARDIAEAETMLAEAGRPEGFVAEVGYDLATAFGVMLPSIGAGVFTRNPNAALAMMGIPAFGDGYETTLNEGGSKEAALQEGLKQVLFELGPEKAFGVFNKALGKTTVNKWIAGVMASEGFSEVSTEALNVINEGLQGKEVGSAQDILKRLGYAGLLGVLLGGGIQGTTAGTRSALDKAARKEQERLALQDAALAQATDQLNPNISGGALVPVGEVQRELAPNPLAEANKLRYQEWLDAGQPPQDIDPNTLALPRSDAGPSFSYEGSTVADLTPPQQAELVDDVPRDTSTLPIPTNDEYWRKFSPETVRETTDSYSYPQAFAPGALRENIAKLSPEAQDLWADYEQQIADITEQENDLWFRFNWGEQSADRYNLDLSESSREEIELEQEELGVAADAIDEEFNDLAREWAKAAHIDNVPYSRGGTRGAWEVVGFNPETGRVFAENDGVAVRRSVTWTLQNPAPKPWYRLQENGEYNWRYKYDKSSRLGDTASDKNRWGVPVEDFSKRVNALYKQATEAGTWKIDYDAAYHLRDKSKTKFKGAKTAAEGKLKYIQDRLKELAKEYARTPWKLTEQVPIKSPGEPVRFKSRRALMEDKIVEEAERLQETKAEEFKKSLENAQDFKVAPLVEDRGATVLSYISKADADRIKRGTIIDGRAYQILPDGSIRVLRIRPSDRLDGVVIEAISQNGRTFDAPKEIETRKQELRPSVAAVLKKIPGRRVIDKLPELSEIRVAKEDARLEREAERDAKARREAEKAYTKRTPGKLGLATTTKEKDELDTEYRIKEEAQRIERDRLVKEAESRARPARETALEKIQAKNQETATPQEKPLEQISIRRPTATPRSFTKGQISSEDAETYFRLKREVDWTLRQFFNELIPFYENTSRQKVLSEKEIVRRGVYKQKGDAPQVLRRVPVYNKKGEIVDYETQYIVGRDDQPIAMTVKGNRQRALFEDAIGAAFWNGASPEELWNFKELLKYYLVNYNPDVHLAADKPIDLLEARELYKGTWRARIPKAFVDKVSPSQVRSALPAYRESLAKAYAAATGMPQEIAEQMVQHAVINQMDKTDLQDDPIMRGIVEVGKQVRGETDVGQPFAGSAWESLASGLREQQITKAPEDTGEAPIVGRQLTSEPEPELNALGQELAKLRGEYEGSSQRLQNTIDSIRREVERSVKESSRARREQLKEIRAAQNTGLLSEEALSRLEEFVKEREKVSSKELKAQFKEEFESLKAATELAREQARLAEEQRVRDEEQEAYRQYDLISGRDPRRGEFTPEVQEALDRAAEEARKSVPEKPSIPEGVYSPVAPGLYAEAATAAARAEELARSKAAEKTVSTPANWELAIREQVFKDLQITPYEPGKPVRGAGSKKYKRSGKALQELQAVSSGVAFSGGLGEVFKDSDWKDVDGLVKRMAEATIKDAIALEQHHPYWRATARYTREGQPIRKKKASGATTPPPSAPRNPSEPPKLTPEQAEVAKRTIALDADNAIEQAIFASNLALESLSATHWLVRLLPKKYQASQIAGRLEAIGRLPFFQRLAHFSVISRHGALARPALRAGKLIKETGARAIGKKALADRLKEERQALNSRKAIDKKLDILRGQANHYINETRLQFSLLIDVLRRETDYKRFSDKWDAALNAYLEGTNAASIERTYGVTLPTSVTEHLNQISVLTRSVSAFGGRFTGAYARQAARGAVIKGRPYLTHMTKQTELTRQAVPELLQDLVVLARRAWALPTTEQDIDKLTDSQALRLLQNRTHGVWANYIRKGAAEGLQDTVAQNALYYNDGKVEIKLGPADESGKLDTSEWKKEQQDAIDEGRSQEAIDAIWSKHMRPIREALKAGLINSDAHYERAIQNLVSRLSDVSLSPWTGASRGFGSVASISLERQLLLSERELVSAAIDSLHDSVYRISDKDASKELKASIRKDLRSTAVKETLKPLTKKEFLDQARARWPVLEKEIDRIEAQFAFNAAIRKALSEVTDTDTLVARTIENITSTVFSSQYLQNILAVGMSQGWAIHSNTKEPVPKSWVPLADKGTSLGETTLYIPGTTTFITGSDIRVPAEIKDKIAMDFGIDSINTNWVGQLPRILHWLSSITKWMKVVVSPIAHTRNFSSTGFIHYSNNLIALGKQRANLGVRLALNQMRRSLTNKQEAKTVAYRESQPDLRRLEAELTKRNVVYDGGRSGALYDVKREGLGIKTDATVAIHGIKLPFRRGKEIAQELFRLEDEGVKFPAVLMQAAEWAILTTGSDSILDNWLDGKELSAQEKLQLEKTLDKAVERVKNTYPTFSRVSPLTKALSRNITIGAFPSFPYEVVRTTLGAISYDLELITAGITGKMADGTPLAEGQKTTASALGLGKLSTKVALWTALGVAGSAFYEYIRQFLPDDEEDEETNLARDSALVLAGYHPIQERIQAMMPWYKRGTHAVISDVDKENLTYTVMELDYLAPTGALNSELLKGMQRIVDAHNSGDESTILAAISAFGASYVNLFAQDEVLLSTIGDRFRERNPQSYPSDRSLKKVADHMQRWMTKHFDTRSVFVQGASALAASSVEQLSYPELVAQMEKLGEWATDFISENPDDPNRDRLELLLKGGMHMMGLKQKVMTFEEDWPRNFASDARRMTEYSSEMRKNLIEGRYETYEEFKTAYDEYDKVRRDHFTILHESMAGVSDFLSVSVNDIARVLNTQNQMTKSAGGHPLIDIYKGRYYGMSRASIANSLEEHARTATTNKISKEDANKLFAWFDKAIQESGFTMVNEDDL